MLLLPPMKFMLLGMFVLFFVFLPFYTLNTLVMPQLMSMEHFYSHEDQTVQSMDFDGQAGQ